MFLIFCGVIVLVSVSINNGRVLHDTDLVSYHNPRTEEASNLISSYHHREKRQLNNWFSVNNPWIQNLAKRFNDFLAPVRGYIQTGQSLSSQISTMFSGLSRTANAIMTGGSDGLNSLQDRILEWRKRANDVVSNYLKRIGFIPTQLSNQMK